MFEHTDALIVAAELKNIFGRVVLAGIIFLAAFRYAKNALDEVLKPGKK